MSSLPFVDVCSIATNYVLPRLKFGLILLLLSGLILPGLTHTDAVPSRYTATVVEGENLTVECNVTSSPDLSVFWTKNESKSTFIQHGVTLKIPNIHRQIAGDYICHCYNRSHHVDNVTVEIVNVDVQYPAKVTMRRISQTVHENEIIQIDCSWEGNPPAAILFKNNNTGYVYVNDTSDKGSFLRGVNTVGCRGWGMYICTGHNYLNQGKESTATDNATVLCAPRWDPSDIDMHYNKTARIGAGFVFFYMKYLSFPPPNVTWEHGGKVLPESRIYDLPDERLTALNISNVAVPDYGEYSLTLTNTFGTFRSTYTLIPRGPPFRPTHLQYHNVTYDSVTLTWTGGYDMGSQQHFLVVDMATQRFLSPPVYDNSTTHGIGAEFTYSQRFLTCNTTYRLSIVAMKSHGLYSPLATPVSFTTEQRPTPPPGKEHTHTVLIAISIVGGLGGIVILILVAYFFVYRRRNMPCQKSDQVIQGTKTSMVNY